MERSEYDRLARVAQEHWWFRSTEALLRQLALPHAPRNGLCLDAGGGAGGTSEWMSDIGTVIACDIDLSVLQSGPSDRPPVVCDLNAQAFAPDSFDVSLCVTALCHQLVHEPADVVAQLARATKPGGLVVLMEPGVRRLRRPHDRATHTARRFSRNDLAGFLSGAGLDVVRATGAYSFLVPPAWMLALTQRSSNESDTDHSPTGLGGVFPALAAIERRLIKHVDLPFGLSVVAVGRRPTH